VASAISLKSTSDFLEIAEMSGGWYTNMGYPEFWRIILPGICIALTVASLTLIDQMVEEIINPRLRRR
jgi:ABC-type dipeptide/oligopeptide/nickel transport system permease subunit